jgi:hypothetical protein
MATSRDNLINLTEHVPSPAPQSQQQSASRVSDELIWQEQLECNCVLQIR